MIFSVKYYTNRCDSKDLIKLLLTKASQLDISEKIKKTLTNNIIKIQKQVNEKTKVDSLKKALVIFSVIEYVKKLNSNIDLNQIFKGAHIIIEDNGELYNSLQKDKILKKRISSHHKNNKSDSDASIQAGGVFKEVLFGLTKCKKTWFQVESSCGNNVKTLLPHILDFITYRLTKKNVGQYGLSEYTESNPIKVSNKFLKAKPTPIQTFFTDTADDDLKLLLGFNSPQDLLKNTPDDELLGSHSSCE